MDKKDYMKTMKYYKRSLIKQKCKTFVLTSFTIGAIFTAPFVVNPIDSIVVDVEVDLEEEVKEQKDTYKAMELVEKVKMLYFFDHNIYAASLTDSILLENASESFKIIDPVNGISDDTLIVENDNKKITFTSTISMFAIKIEKQSLRNIKATESLTYYYDNDRNDCLDVIQTDYKDGSGVIMKAPFTENKDGNVRKGIMNTIDTKFGSIQFYDNFLEDSFMVLDGNSIVLNDEQYEEMKVIFDNALINGSVIENFYIIADKFDVYKTAAKTLTKGK